jgi:hypothetical protein
MFSKRKFEGNATVDYGSNGIVLILPYPRILHWTFCESQPSLTKDNCASVRRMKGLFGLALTLLVSVSVTLAQNSSLSSSVNTLPQCAVRTAGPAGASQLIEASS